MHAGAGGLADGEEAGQGRAAVEVGDDAAHPVVRGGRHGDRLDGPVEPGLTARGVEAREAAARKRASERRRVEEHGRAALLGHAPPHRAGDDVARRELGARVDVEHEAVAASRRRSTAPSPRTASEMSGRARRGERRRVELHELEVGDRRAGTPGRGDAVAGRDVGIRRVPVELPAAAGREHDGVGAHVDGAGCRRAGARPSRGRRAPRRPPALDEQVDEHRGSWIAHRAAPHRATSARSIAAPVASPPACRMRARECAASSPRSRPESPRSNATPKRIRSRTRAGPSSQSTRTASGSHEAGAGLEGVREVPLDGVVGEQRRGDAALGVARVAVGELGLRDELDRRGRRRRPSPRSRGRRCRRRRRGRAPWSGSRHGHRRRRGGRRLRREHPLEGERVPGRRRRPAP